MNYLAWCAQDCIVQRMSESIYALAIEIIRATNDGDDLAPQHLKLVEYAVNGALSERGEIAFNELLAQVRAGYQKPWFHGIEQMTIDHEGYVYWKGTQVEHYTPGWAFSPEARDEALRLAERCRHLEALGVPVNSRNAVWDWELYASASAEEPGSPGRDGANKT